MSQPADVRRTEPLHYLYPASDLAADTASGPVEVSVSQIGIGGSSHPARLVLAD